jgi:manganese/zinc/iron transport system substrate-binding protein
MFINQRKGMMKMKKSILSYFIMLVLLLGTWLLSACGVEEVQGNSDKIKVTTTIAQIADGVRNIGGDHVEVTSLMGPGIDPHLYKATQSDIGKLQDADIIFYNGLHLEGKMLEVFEKIGNDKPTYAIADTIPKEMLRKDVSNQTAMDPHVWFDIDLWKISLEQVRDGLIELDPKNKEEYERNTKEYFAKLDKLKQFAATEIEKIPEEQRVLVTAHDAFHYFGAKYDMKVDGLQGLSTDSEYGLADVQSLVSRLVENKIKAVFIESSISEKSINAVIEGAEDRGHEVKIGGELYSDAMGEEGTSEATYIGMYKHNVKTIVEALK